MLCRLILLLTLLITPCLVQAAAVSDLRMAKDGDHTRIVLDIDAELPYRVFALGNPARIVVDLPKMSFAAPMNKGDASGTVKAYRQSIYKGDTLRIVFDLKQPAVITSTMRLPPDQKRPWRYVIDLKQADAVTFQKNVNRLVLGGGAPESATQNMDNGAVKPLSAPADKQQAAGTTANAPFPATQTAPSLVRKPLVIIDAGHGGVDPGAHAVTGEHEKNITLAVARKVRDRLNATGRYRVKLTRDTDIYIKLPERVAIARRAGADLFISLHADTISRPLVHGASVYTLSDKASDIESEKLAQRENAVDTLVNVDVGDVDKDVANILIDLVTRDTMNQSRTLAETVVRSFHDNKLLTLPERPHRSAGFAVLKAPDIPSILIEMGYLSNPQEARNLGSDNYRDKIAEAVSETVDSFFAHLRGQ